jgi:hypothetical protein
MRASFFKAAGAVVKIGLSLKVNHLCQNSLPKLVKHSVDFEDHLSRGTLISENVFNLVQSFSTGVAPNFFFWCVAKPLIDKERMQKLLFFIIMVSFYT